MFILNQELKSKIGLLIEYYREERYQLTKNKRWLKMNFIKDERGYFICSDRTYRKMISGIPLLKEDLYDIFLDKLGVSFENLKKEEEIIFKEYSQALLQAMKQGNQSEIMHLAITVRKRLRKYQSYFYYQEYAAVIELINQYFKMQWMSLRQYQKLQQIIPIFNDEWQVIVKYLIIEYCYMMYRDSRELLVLRKKLELSKHSDPMLAVSELYLDMLETNGAEAYEKAQMLLPMLKQQGYDILYLRTVSIIATLSINLHPDGMLEQLQKMEEIAVAMTSNISSFLIGRCFYSVGSHLLIKQKYDLAKQHLLRAMQFNPLLVELAGIYLYYIGKIKNEPINLETVIKEANVIRQLNDKFIVMETYYSSQELSCYAENKEPADAKERRTRKKRQMQYIMKQIKPLLFQDEQLLIQIFQEELNELATQLNQYQDAYFFRRYFPTTRL